MLEQTVELPRAVAARDPWVAAHILGAVERIEPAGDDLHRVTIAQPLATAAGDPAQLLNVLFGNSSLQPDVVLADVDLPDRGLRLASGPARRHRRAPGAHRRRRPAAARHGAQADGPRAGAARGAVRHCSRARASTWSRTTTGSPTTRSARSRRGWRPASAPSRTRHGRPAGGRSTCPTSSAPRTGCGAQLEFAREAGAAAVMLSPMLDGPAAARSSSRRSPMACRSSPIPRFGGVLRAAEPALFGKLFRWFGADAVIFPHAGGRFSYSPETCAALAGGAPAPAPARAARVSRRRRAASSVERVAELLEFYGQDCILLIGGSLYEAGDALFERTPRRWSSGWRGRRPRRRSDERARPADRAVPVGRRRGQAVQGRRAPTSPASPARCCSRAATGSAASFAISRSRPAAGPRSSGTTMRMR